MHISDLTPPVAPLCCLDWILAISNVTFTVGLHLSIKRTFCDLHVHRATRSFERKPKARYTLSVSTGRVHGPWTRIACTML